VTPRTSWDGIVKNLLRQAFGDDYSESFGAGINYGEGAARARIDGTIARRIAVEVESRTDKQIRGALLDLICHNLENKLLIVVPVHMTNEHRTIVMCQNILARFVLPANFRVVLLELDKLTQFAEVIRAAARDLGWSPPVINEP